MVQVHLSSPKIPNASAFGIFCWNAYRFDAIDRKIVVQAIGFASSGEQISSDQFCHPERSRTCAAKSKDLRTKFPANRNKMRRFFDSANAALRMTVSVVIASIVLLTKADSENRS